MKVLRITAGFICFLAINVWADSFGVSLSNRSVDAFYDASLSKSFNIKTSFLHTDVNDVRIKPRHGRRFKEDTRTDKVAVGLFNGGDVGPVRLFVGGELYWLQTNIDEVHKGKDRSYGLAVGGGIDAFIIPKLFTGASIMYAPDILTNGDHQSLLEFNARIGYQIISRSSLYLAYRYIETTGKQWDIRPYNGPIIGFTFSF